MIFVPTDGWRALCSTVCKWYAALFLSSLGGALALALVLMGVDPDASKTYACPHDPAECDPRLRRDLLLGGRDDRDGRVRRRHTDERRGRAR